MELIVKNVSKTIGHKEILKNVNLTLKSGRVYGFVGRNGSGKTMLFRAISGLMNVSSGEIWLDEKVLHRDMKVLPDLGIVLENAGLYPDLSAKDNLRMLANINRKVTDKRIEEIIRIMELDPSDKKPFKKFSLGMKQRLVLAQAFMENPKILMLDEPTNALDEKGIELVRKLILEEKKKGTLVLLASHNREDIEMVADEVFVVKNGMVSAR